MLTSIIIAGYIISIATAFFIGKKNERNNIPKYKDALKDKRIKEESIKYLKNRLKNYEEQIENIENARDKYKKIATTHNIKLSKDKIVEVPIKKTTQVWSNRFFNGTLEMNLRYLAEDIEQFGNKEICIQIQSTAKGGWREIMEKAGWYIDNKPTCVLTKKTLTFYGPPNRVAEQLHAWFNDVDNGFVTRLSLDKGWADKDSLLIWEVDLQIIETDEPKLSDFQIVEVAVPEIFIKEIIVEKPIAVGTGETLLFENDVVALANAVYDIRTNGKPAPTLYNINNSDFDSPLLKPDEGTEEVS